MKVITTLDNSHYRRIVGSSVIHTILSLLQHLHKVGEKEAEDCQCTHAHCVEHLELFILCLIRHPAQKVAYCMYAIGSTVELGCRDGMLLMSSHLAIWLELLH